MLWLSTDGTSYESYDEEDAEVNPHEVVYENQMLGHDVLLPRWAGRVIDRYHLSTAELT